MRRYSEMVMLLWTLLFVTSLSTARAAEVPEMPQLSGRVIDKNSGKGIPLSTVVASVGGDYSAPLGHGGYRRLYSVAVTADETGRFTVPSWKWATGRRMSLESFGVSVTAYHPDYVFFSDGRSDFQFHPIRQVPFTGKPVDRLDNLAIPMTPFVPEGPVSWGTKLAPVLDLFKVDWDGEARGAAILYLAMKAEIVRLAPNAVSDEFEKTDAWGPLVVPWKQLNQPNRPSKGDKP
jgi:hypothetical protein